MKRLYLAIFLLPSLLFGQQKMFDPPVSKRIANYTIDCRLDPEKKIITGTEELVWKNSSHHSVNELQFHLYQNAFSNAKSSLLTELSEFPEQLTGHWGYCKILKMELPDGTDLVPRLIYIQPDDDNPFDKTGCSVKLPKMLVPGKELFLSITFEKKLPPWP